jgi:hypothetical protein
VSHWGPKYSHNGVADVLVNAPPITVHALAQLGQAGVDQVHYIFSRTLSIAFGVALLNHGTEARDVGKQHAYRLAFALQRAAPGGSWRRARQFLATLPAILKTGPTRRSALGAEHTGMIVQTRRGVNQLRYLTAILIMNSSWGAIHEF